MVRNRRQSSGGRLGGLLTLSSRSARSSHIAKLQEKHRIASEATVKWLSLLRELERSGEINDARYHQYFDAYLQAKQQEKRADLALFNAREGLIS